MKIRMFFLCVIIFFLGVSSLKAQFGINPQKEDEIPPWMEKINQQGNATYLVPKGAKREKVGSQFIVETINEYTARKIYELEDGLAKVKENQQKMEEEIQSLKDALEQQQKDVEENLKKSQELIESFRQKFSEMEKNVKTFMDKQKKEDEQKGEGSDL